MKVKLKDVALAAGVSISTVSRVINCDRERPASPETSNRIWAIVKELGYVPNTSAKNLVKGVKDSPKGFGRIGCIYTSTIDIKTDPFFSCIGIGIQSELRSHGLEMAYALSTYRMGYAQIYNFINKHPAQGVIITGPIESELLELVQKNYKHIVYAGSKGVDSHLDQVICDGYNGAKTAISHLMDRGHSRIGYVGYVYEPVSDQGDGCELSCSGEAEEQVTLEHRYRAYCDLMTASAGSVNHKDVIHTRLYTTSAYESMTAYLEKTLKDDLPSAFYCANDASAFGVMKAIKDCGYKIPEDIAVIGLDDVEMSRYVTPTLSTVSIPRKSLGIQGVKLLVDQMASQRDYPIRMDLPFELKIRESTQVSKKK